MPATAQPVLGKGETLNGFSLRLLPVAALLAGVAAGAPSSAGAASPLPSTADDPQAYYGRVPAPHGGDILSVSSAYGPPANAFWVNAFVSTRSDSSEAYRALNVNLLYGLSERTSFGVSASHFQQDLGWGPTGVPINKRGPGDTRVFFKWAAPSRLGSPLAWGVRPSLRIPTGYDLEGDGLIPFSTRTVDFECLFLLAYETAEVGVYLNPGFSLPGGKWHNEALGGVGIDVRGGLPFQFTLSGEYFMRYDIPEERFQHEIFAGVGHGLPFGLAVEMGFRKRLLQGEDPGPESTLRLCRGRSTGLPPAMIPRPRTRPTRVLVAPITSQVTDPHSMSSTLRHAIVRELSRQPGISATTEGRGEYTARLEIISMEEATGRRLSIPRVLATPTATLEITARVSLTHQDGSRVLEEHPLNLQIGRGTGMKLFPSAADEDTWVPKAQTRTALRADGLERLAQKAADQVARIISAEERR